MGNDFFLPALIGYCALLGGSAWLSGWAREMAERGLFTPEELEALRGDPHHPTPEWWATRDAAYKRLRRESPWRFLMWGAGGVAALLAAPVVAFFGYLFWRMAVFIVTDPEGFPFRFMIGAFFIFFFGGWVASRPAKKESPH